MKFVWNEKIGIEGDPYIIRWYFECKWFSIRLHHWLSSDDLRYPHDHDWDFISIIFKGGYEDVSPSGNEKVKAGDIRFRKHTHQHSVKVNPGGCWSILLTGPKKHNYGFYVDGKFVKRNRYFFDYGHHTDEHGGSKRRV